MLIKAILLGLVSLVAVVDSRLIGRQNIGRPLILSTLAGLVLGDMKQSLILRLLSFRVLLQKKLCHLLFL